MAVKPSPGTVLKLKPRFWGKPKLRFWRGSKSVLRPHWANGRADSLNDAVLNDFLSAEQCERRLSKRCGWVHVGVRLFTHPLSESLRPRFCANKPYFPTTIHLVAVHGQYAPGCLLPMHGPTNGDAARHQQFFHVQFTFHFDALTILKIGNYPTHLTDLRNSPFY